jgi:hypothetical protein
MPPKPAGQRDNSGKTLYTRRIIALPEIDPGDIFRCGQLEYIALLRMGFPLQLLRCLDGGIGLRRGVVVDIVEQPVDAE